MSEIDKNTVWAVVKNMRLLCFIEYLTELEADPTPSKDQVQIARYLREFMHTGPDIPLNSDK